MPELELSFRPGQVHIWKVPLPLSEGTVARLKECLSFDERERSRKLRFAQDQWKYISARGALRSILGSYLNERPDALTFGYGTRGKPFLANPAGARMITFNLSHCKDMAVIGIAPCQRIGVDVEAIRELPDLETIVERHFSREERTSIGSANGEAKSTLFFQFWTRREAAAKACGLDLSAALSDLEIPLYPSGTGARLKQKGDCAWSLRDLQLGPTHIGAVCVEGKACDTIFRNFDPLLRGIDQ